ncbi:hypothetical protein M7I_2733 [Glarea lozoyensis 74030]|nr:hypothetical protein M7I_2733 [Glarea lozoyensis 74030]
MDRYEHEYLEINEGCAPMLEDFRNLRRVIRNRPWGFYPSAVSGSRRQTLPLSAWLCVQFGYASPIDQPDKYDQAIISYTEYLKEVATPDQWKDFQSTLDQKAERDRVALYFERMDYAECDYDIVLPSVASIPWTLFTQDQQQLFWFLDRIQSNDPRFAVPSSYSYAATTIEELQREAIFLRRQRLAQGIPEPVEENILLCPDCWNLASECNGSCAVSEVNVASRPQSRGQCTVTLEEVHESDNNGGWALDANDFLPTGANAVEVSPHRMNHYANSECSTIRAGFTGFMDNGEQAADGSSSPTIRATGAEPEQRPQDGDAHIDLYEVGGNPLRFAIGPDGKPTLVRDPSGPLRVIGHEDGLLSLELDLEPESDDEDNFHSRRHRVC